MITKSNPFDYVKDNVDIIAVAEFYGMKVVKNKALCCFHDEKTPSLNFKYNRFNCFGCNAKGSVIDLVMKLLDLKTPVEAVKRINADFNLCLDLDKNTPPISQARRQELTAIKQELDRWCNKKYLEYAEQLQKYMDYLKDLKPAETDQELEARHLEAVEKIQIVDFRMCILKNGTIEERLELFKLLRVEA